MSGDWIALRMDLGDDPAVIAIAGACCIDQDMVVGKLHRLWSWANAHTTDGFIAGINARWVDDFVRKKGFSGAMTSTGWIVFDQRGVTFPNFQRWNGESAKQRLQKNRRQAKWRDGQTSTTASTDASTLPSTDATTTEQNRTEHRKATTKPTREPPAAFAPPVWVPKSEWEDFDEMRRKKSGKAWTLRAKELAIDDLAKLVEQGEDPAAVLRQSVVRSWAGLFPMERGKRDPPRQSIAERRTSTVDAIIGRGNGRDITGTAERVDQPAIPAISEPVREPDGDDVGIGRRH